MTTILSSRCRNPLLAQMDLESTPEWLQLTNSINDLSTLTSTQPHLQIAKITRTEDYSQRSYPTTSTLPISVHTLPPPSPHPSPSCYFCTPEPQFMTSEGTQRSSMESTRHNESSDVLFRPGSAEFRGSRERLHEIFENNRRLRKIFFEDGGLDKVNVKVTGFGSTETLGSQSNGSSGDGKGRGVNSPDYGDDGVDMNGKEILEKDNGQFTGDFVNYEECNSLEKMKTSTDTLKSPRLVSSFSNSRLDLNEELRGERPPEDTKSYTAGSNGGLRDTGNGSSIPFVYGPIPYKSPRRYVEGEVTIHYRSPVRTEAKEILSEEELARRSAENMRRVYQEERRRKYLQELHDIDSRRHTDNFTPSQKSPIPLNRYDDFLDDSSYRSRSQEETPEPRVVARALYNFVGQTSRELSFRRGDIILIRRQIDKNWYEGEHNAMIGLFPLNYVEILPYDGTRGTPKKSYEGQARAKFNFIAQTNLELSLAKGELVVLTRRVDENWFEGRVGSKKGIFPVTYVEVIVEPGQHRPETPVSGKPVASPAAHSMLSNGTASGKLSMGPHHYIPSIPVKTSTAEPQYISLPRIGVTERNKLHVAPVNETLHIDTHSDTLPYRALYNYRPQNEDELELREGDTVYVMEKCDDGWFVGSSQRSGYFGTFPGNYVERL